MRQRLHHDMMFFTDEVSEEMLMAIIDKMCACAVRAQKAGVDVIQIHGDRLNGCLCSTRMNHALISSAAVWRTASALPAC